MTFTTPPPPVDLARAVPGMGAHVRTTVRLHPRPGSPGRHESHVGGPLLWPASEPWPQCEASDCDQYEGIPMVAVGQLTAADFPEIAFPRGTDLVQILWCVGYHCCPQHAPCRVVWRRAAEVTDVLEAPPVPDLEGELPGFYDGAIPRPCVLHPERVTEYPWHQELPADLRDRLWAWDEGKGLYDEVATAPGFKVGGSMDWSVSDMARLECVTCAAPTVLLLQADSYEAAGGRWQPLEERHLVFGTPEYERAEHPTGMELARGGHGGFFVCSADPEHPVLFHSH
ncbi:hypothetical protein NE236_09470 [Actinoallomurus purpureus]|uniref:hypothetical protein n=1 Tax=Actinoallomurus purpureus TaxID=478114 RepID=UPI0020926E47|nr:hypothetical protein [Actinoallomurus purpureus]MCO6005213.1 hypothetical protein [Actinoallomurus purpureus]